MTKKIISLTNAITGENIVREMNDEELEYQAQIEAESFAEQQVVEARKLAKAAAEAKLEALGLTADDLRALGL